MFAASEAHQKYQITLPRLVKTPHTETLPNLDLIPPLQVLQRLDLQGRGKTTRLPPEGHSWVCGYSLSLLVPNGVYQYCVSCLDSSVCLVSSQCYQITLRRVAFYC